MVRRGLDTVVIGGSAGGLGPAVTILEALPSDFPAAVFLAIHRRTEPELPDRLAQIVGRKTRLPAESALDKKGIVRSRVYVAAGDHHLVLENGLIRVQRSPKENRFRPSIDVLFKSAAMNYGRRVIGVLLSGVAGNDGAAGLWHIRNRGGITMVQDPTEAQFPGMPQAAIDDVAIDYVLPVAQIGPKVIDLVLSSAANQASGPVRILIVEDESVVATNLQQSLAEMGYQVIDWVPTGEAAIELAGNESPDLVLMDIHLAGRLTGIESARQIWQRLQIPIVYCTAHADLETLTAVQATESYGYVVKPFQSSAVRAAIELALARREKELNRHQP